ncbi:hypothetical protein [Streptomyces sp. NPDC051704]|uniref:hypothetical protein n=1 Tax=Streptomyces sp. NPDC051704 TaxID=3365671 RepID=UPI0037952A6E
MLDDGGVDWSRLSWIGHRLGFQTEIGHRLGNSFVQLADLVVRPPAVGVPVLLLEIDRRTADAQEKQRRVAEREAQRPVGGAGRSSPTSAGRRPPRAAAPGRPT